MTRQYTSFLIRCWRLSEDEQRIKVEHIQSGEDIQVATLADATAWIGRCMISAPGRLPSMGQTSTGEAAEEAEKAGEATDTVESNQSVDGL